MPGSPNEIGFAFIILSLVFLGAALIRRWISFLRKLFIPTALIGGFLILALGPEGLGHLTNGNGIFPDDTIAVWKVLPGLLINVMCASLLLGERLPHVSKIWGESAPHVIMAGVMSSGQYAVGCLLVILLLRPLFDMPDEGGAMIEMSFAGGHGTLAGLSNVLFDHGVGELLDFGLGLATIGMVTGVVIGTVLVNYAVKSPSISVARENPPQPEEDLDIDHHIPGPNDPPLDESQGMGQLTAAAVFLGVSIAVGIGLLQFLQWATNLVNSTIFDQFPLFPFTIVGGVIVQLCAVRFDFEWAVNRRAVEGIGGLSVDGIIVCAIGTLSLSALADNIGPLLILAVGSVGWSIFVAMFLGRRLFTKNWFEHSIAEYGESQGNVATGFMLVDMVDPARHTDVITSYGYRQLVTRPLIGGGFITAISVPFIADWGLSLFTIITVASTIGFAAWGLMRVRNAGEPS